MTDHQVEALVDHLVASFQTIFTKGYIRGAGYEGMDTQEVLAEIEKHWGDTGAADLTVDLITRVFDILKPEKEPSDDTP